MQKFEQTGELKVENEILEKIKQTFVAHSANDQETSQTIKEIYHATGETLDPHTATALNASKKFMQSAEYEGEFVINLATAHPAKFPEAIKDAGLPDPQLPKFLQDIFSRQEKFTILENNIDNVKDFITKNLTS